MFFPSFPSKSLQGSLSMYPHLEIGAVSISMYLQDNKSNLIQSTQVWSWSLSRPEGTLKNRFFACPLPMNFSNAVPCMDVRWTPGSNHSNIYMNLGLWTAVNMSILCFKSLILVLWISQVGDSSCLAPTKHALTPTFQRVFPSKMTSSQCVKFLNHVKNNISVDSIDSIALWIPLPAQGAKPLNLSWVAGWSLPQCSMPGDWFRQAIDGYKLT